jgi:hypothetical protein
MLHWSDRLLRGRPAGLQEYLYTVWKAGIQSFDFTFSEDSDWYTVKKYIEVIPYPWRIVMSALSNFFPVQNSSDEGKHSTHDGKHSTIKEEHKILTNTVLTKVNTVLTKVLDT